MNYMGCFGECSDCRRNARINKVIGSGVRWLCAECGNRFVIQQKLRERPDERNYGVCAICEEWKKLNVDYCELCETTVRPDRVQAAASGAGGNFYLIGGIGGATTGTRPHIEPTLVSTPKENPMDMLSSFQSTKRRNLEID